MTSKNAYRLAVYLYLVFGFSSRDRAAHHGSFSDVFPDALPELICSTESFVGEFAFLCLELYFLRDQASHISKCVVNEPRDQCFIAVMDFSIRFLDDWDPKLVLVLAFCED